MTHSAHFECVQYMQQLLELDEQQDPEARAAHHTRARWLRQLGDAHYKVGGASSHNYIGP